MEFKFVADRIVRDKAYPAFARHSAQPYTPSWREFVQHWPHTVPVELHEHCQTHNFPYQLQRFDNSSNAYYTVGLGFFNFSIDYFELIPQSVFDSVQAGQLTVLFYYHEGDNPFDIQDRLDHLCHDHQLPLNCYRFVSGNTAADQIPGFVWFPDHELLYWKRNAGVPALPTHGDRRSRQFTALSRTHKWWRATVMTDLLQTGILDHSYWSYNTNVALNEDPKDNPIEVDTLNLQSAIDRFLSNGPYTCDSMTADQHNNHRLIEPLHFQDSYCNIVLETHFDADGSRGAFLTEKTFKCLKHGQPFVIVGAPGSLKALRSLGYRTFDRCIDNSYDQITDNTQRWIAIRKTLQQIQNQDMHQWFMNCLDDVEHNQQLFCESKYPRLNNLLERLNND